jgi:uncharacterized protein (TIGR03067 family)
MLQLFALASCVLAAPPEDFVRREEQALDGNWRLVSAEQDGRLMPAQQANDFSLTFKKGKFTSYQGGNKLGGNKQTGAYTLDPTKKPKTIDIVPDAGPDKGKSWSLIYIVEGNTLRICCRAIGEDRPASFDTKDQKGVTLMVFRHVD